MTTVGFDVSKDSLAVACLNRSGQLMHSDICPNTAAEIASYLQALRNRYSHLTLVAEATGEYHRVLALTSLELGLVLKLLNPIMTKQFTRATVRGKKTDPSDAVIIARLALQGEGVQVTAGMFTKAKPFTRTAANLIRAKQRVVAMAKHVRAVMPEETAAVAQLLDCASSLEQTAICFRAQATQTLDSHQLKLLCSIPGVGPTIAATIVSEVGDVERFKTAKALVAYAGLDPRVRQSGTTLSHNTSLTKRGTPYLRRDLFIAASVAKRWDPDLRAYYEKKRGEGRTYTEAIIAVSRKLLYRVYAVWKRNGAYVKRTPGVDTTF